MKACFVSQLLQELLHLFILYHWQAQPMVPVRQESTGQGPDEVYGIEGLAVLHGVLELRGKFRCHPLCDSRSRQMVTRS